MDDGRRSFLEEALPHLDAVYRVARHLGQDHHRAEDLVQETFLRAFTAFERKPPDNTRAWLIAICLNLVRSEGRKRRRRVSETALDVAREQVALGRTVDDEAIAGLDREKIATTLKRLPREQRVAVVLMDLAGLSASEAGAILGCSRNTVLSRAHRGHKRLAAYLLDRDVSRDLP